MSGSDAPAAPAVTVDGDTVARLARGVKLREDPVRGQTVLLAPERALALDEIAVAIVRALDGKRSLDEIAGDFSRKFDAPKEAVLADVVAFIREFSNRRLLELAS
ncbi:pyrroloquinoline quinone biosynthesis peptide chaperone PqqD [Rhizobium daejeonense]